MKRVIYFNEEGFEALKNTYETVAYNLQGLLESFKKSYGQKIGSSDIDLLLANPRALLIKALSQGQAPTFLGMKVNIEKAFELIEKPEGYKEYESQAENLRERFNHLNRTECRPYPISVERISDQFHINSDGLIELNAGIEDKMKPFFELTIESERAMIIHDFLLSVKQSYEQTCLKLGKKVDYKAILDTGFMDLNDSQSLEPVVDAKNVKAFDDPYFFGRRFR